MTRALLTWMSLLGIMICGAAAWGLPSEQDPYIGYVYPAGGQQGTVFRVIIGGQRIRGVGRVFVSGDGVRARAVGYEGVQGPLDKLQQEELQRQLIAIRDQRMGKQSSGKRAEKEQKALATTGGRQIPTAAFRTALPDLPELRKLEQQSNKQLQRLAERFLNPQKRTKPPIAEKVTLEVTMDSDAAPGDREIRLGTTAGLSNPLVFEVSQIPEVRAGGKDEDMGEITPMQTPVVLNGQIMPGEVDRFPLQLRAKQKLIVAAQARKLIPYLADAVPGWFQAVVALYDPDGKELAYGNECGYDPDPAFLFQAPRDGKYTLEVRDALYRGREDFVYRVAVGDESLAKTLFPSGGRGGVPLGAACLDQEMCLKMAREHFQLAENPLPEVEPNDTGQKSMRVTLPRVISGCIAKPGDRDVFSFNGRAGEQVVAEVYARRMGSPLDSLLRLIDTTGHVVAWNDDYKDIECGLLTQPADSYLSAKLPKTGLYFVQLSEAQGHGGREFSYCLRIGPPQPDFALRMTPSCLNMTAGRATVATLYAVRKDGWDGDIEVSPKNGVDLKIDGGVIPKGQDHVRMTLTPRGRLDQSTALALEGRAQIGGKTVTRPVIAADDMMQAFAYRHLVPSEQLVFTVRRGTGISVSLDLARGKRLQIPAGSTAQVSFSMPTGASSHAQFEISEPPAGVTLQSSGESQRGYTLVLKADDKHIGYADNLIIEGYTEVVGRQKTGVGAQKQRASLGVLPAIPFEIVKR